MDSLFGTVWAVASLFILFTVMENPEVLGHWIGMAVNAYNEVTR